MITGACLCGALRYELDAPVGELVHCHCPACRKHHGAPFATLVAVPPSALRWLSGEDLVQEHAASSQRSRRFCGTCGAVAPTRVGERVLVPAGNLLGELGETGSAHMCVGSKAPWHVIADGAPQFEGSAPGWAAHEAGPFVRPRLEGAVHGSCSCGAVAFSVTGAPLRWLQCHCSRCRRGRSAAHASNTFFPAAQFAWRSGRELVRGYKVPEAERFMVSFCVQCGGGAPVEREKVPFVLVPAALLDADLGLGPQAHIHVASKASWFTLGRDLPQFAELPPP